MVVVCIDNCYEVMIVNEDRDNRDKNEGFYLCIFSYIFLKLGLGGNYVDTAFGILPLHHLQRNISVNKVAQI